MSTGIPYLDKTWNPVTGCSGVGCKCRDTCWARGMVRRFPRIHGHWSARVDSDTYVGGPLAFDDIQFHPDLLDKPLHWRKPRRIGVCFMGELFDEGVKPEWIDAVWLVMEQAYWHTYFVLTKQPRNLFRYYQEVSTSDDRKWPLDNVVHGVSITDQEDADRMIPELLRVPGKRWISLEPMLGPVDLPLSGGIIAMIDWVVIGCESGPKRRPCKPEWVHDVVIQCHLAGVPVYVKQLSINGKVSHNPENWPAWACQKEIPESAGERPEHFAEAGG